MPFPAFSKSLFLKILQILAASALLLLLSTTALHAASEALLRRDPGGHPAFAQPAALSFYSLLTLLLWKSTMLDLSRIRLLHSGVTMILLFPTSTFRPLLIQTLLGTCLLLVGVAPPASARQPFTLTSGDYQEITREHIEFLEGVSPDTPLEVLQSADWQDTLSSKQANVEGFWMKFQLQNQSASDLFGLTVAGVWPSNTESGIHVVHSDGTTQAAHWSYGDPYRGVDRLVDSYKASLPPEEVSTIYLYGKSTPFDRRSVGLDKVGVMEWSRLDNWIDNDNNSSMVMAYVVGSFAVYYLLFFLVSKEINYFWLSMLSLSFSLVFSVWPLATTGILPLVLATGESGVSLSLSLAMISGLQFCRSLIDMKASHLLLDRMVLACQIGFMCVFTVNLLGVLYWPAEQHLDLITHPPDGQGNTLLKTDQLMLASAFPFILWLYAAFQKWRGGSRSAGMAFLALSPLLLAIVVTVFPVDFTIADYGRKLSVLLAFILLGLAVAQRLNDLKQLVLEQQMRLTEAYQRFVPEQLLSNLEKESILDVQLGDQVQKEMSILFSDIRSFTTLSESMSPEENFRFINSYLGRMGPLVRDNHGYIDKYIGDAIMALFDHSADDAVRTSVQMLEALREYNEGRLRAGYEPIRIGIGINTGMMMLGTLGEADRMEGSVISDAVNLAARLEGLTKLYRTPLLVSEATRSRLTPDAFRMRLIDKVAVKGKEESVLIHEVLDAEAPEEREVKLGTLDAFNEGWELYQNQHFKRANAQFQECLEQAPDDTVAALYVERCEALLSNGWDAENWDGVNRMDTK
jgi:class 3 adenylate cyclase